MRPRRWLIAVLALAALVGAAPSAAVAGTGLRLGSSGAKVVTLQRLLDRAGYDVVVDGAFGRATQAAVRAFQGAARLAPSGAAGPKTFAALRRAPRAGPKPVTPAPAPPPASSLGAPVLPADAPGAVRAALDAAGRIAVTPYRYGGGHRSFDDTGYDCSGSVSYALHGAGLLDRTMTSGELEDFGEAGPGAWITIYAKADHVYMTIAGVRFDTSGLARTGSRWQPSARSADGFVVRHPPGL